MSTPNSGLGSNLSALTPGFADPAHDAQQLFRSILDAMSHPGRVVSLSAAPVGPGALSCAATGYLLTLVDRDTPVWLAPPFDQPAVRDFLRFHAGSPIVADRAAASFGVLAADASQPLEGFNLGTDAYPDRSATLVIEVTDLRSGPLRQWRGPGIDGRASVAIAGLTDAFWQDWAANHALFPCGVDLVFTAGTELCALPRSVAVEG
jgi:alpha-D-ribose 1-methylphosphonate 5-triphosphate synthase subunit PhnH